MVVPKQLRHSKGFHRRNLGSIRQGVLDRTLDGFLDVFMDLLLYINKCPPGFPITTSFRPWLGPKNTSAFHVPGMEFFATTGVYKNEREWRSPAGTWLRQIIPKGEQLPNFLDEIEKICNDLNKDCPGYDFHNEDDSLDGRITLSHKGVHFASTLHGYSGYVAVLMGFEEDELDMVLNQRLTKALQSTDCLHISIPCTSARLTPRGRHAQT